MLKRLPRLSSARVRHHCESASRFLSKSGANCCLKKKGRGPRVVNDSFMEPRKLFPAKMMFFLGLDPSVLLQPKTTSFSPFLSSVSFQWFPLWHDTLSLSADISAGLSILRGSCCFKLLTEALSHLKSWAMSSLEEGLPYPKRSLWVEHWGAGSHAVGHVHSLYTVAFERIRRDGWMIECPKR